MDRRTKVEGFTLVELLVAMLFTFILLGVIYSVYRVQAHTVKIQERRQEAQEYARSVLDLMVREIRNAAYNPTQATSGANCAGGSAGAPAVVTATANSIRFTYDFRGASSTSVSDGDCGDTDEDITYAYDTSGCSGLLGNITRNGASNPLTECNVTNLDLRYFQQDGTELSRPVTGANLSIIQRVKMTLTVQSKDSDAEFGGQMTSTVYSNIDLRNRGL